MSGELTALPPGHGGPARGGPYRRSAPPEGGAIEIHREVAFGDLATFAVVDNRQYRDPVRDRILGFVADEGGLVCGADHDELVATFRYVTTVLEETTAIGDGPVWVVTAGQPTATERR